MPHRVRQSLPDSRVEEKQRRAVGRPFTLEMNFTADHLRDLKQLGLWRSAGVRLIKRYIHEIPDSVFPGFGDIGEILGQRFFRQGFLGGDQAAPELVMGIIGKRAFANCAGFTALAVPEGTTRLGDQAFAGCVNAESVSIPSTLNSYYGSIIDSCPKMSTFQVISSHDMGITPGDGMAT